MKKFTCDLCGKVIDHPEHGWVSWFTQPPPLEEAARVDDPRYDAVISFYVTCHNTYGDQCAERVLRAERARGGFVWDHHLDMFCGKNTEAQAISLLGRFNWPKELIPKLVHFFFSAQHLPGRKSRC